MLNYIIKRLLLVLPVLLAVTFVIFTLLYFTPGNPAKAMLGEVASPEALAALEEELGLNDPFLVRYFDYLLGLLQGDMGTSYRTDRPVSEELFNRLPTTLNLALLSIVIAVAIGIPVGIISATKQYSWFDNISMVFALLGVSMPNFWQGMVLILVFAVWLGILPVSGFTTPAHWILPAVTIGTSTAAIIARMTRSSMLEVNRQDYIRTARAKGQKESVVIMKHQLKNALIPVITVVGLQFGALLGGAVLTETIFAVPGIGRYMVEAIKNRDYPVIQGGVLLIAVIFTFVNLFVDILYAYADPRIKATYSQAKLGGPLKWLNKK